MTTNRIQTESAIGLVRAYLLSLPAITALVSNRISGSWPEAADQGSIAHPSIALRSIGSPRLYSGVIGIFELEITAVSSISASEARKVYDLVYQSLQAEGLSVENLDHRGLIRENDGGRDGWWEAGRCWLTSGYWSLSLVRDNAPP